MNNRCKRCGKGSHSTQVHDAVFSRPESSAVPPDFKSFSQCSSVSELIAWLKSNALPPYRHFALALACKLESFSQPAPAEVTAEQQSVWVWEEYIDGLWYPYQDKYNCDSLNVHPSNKFVRQPEPHTPQYGRFRWAEYVRLAAAKGGRG